jgi:hypothetical protein
MGQVESIFSQFQGFGAVAADPLEHHAPNIALHAVSNGSAWTEPARSYTASANQVWIASTRPGSALRNWMSLGRGLPR